MNTLKVAFDNPEAGWVMLTIRYNGETVNIVASYICNSIFHLTDALHRLLVEQGQATVTWLAEPVEYEMRFVRNGETINMQIEQFPDHRRDAALGHLLLSTSGTFTEVCLPFWRALRALQGRFSAKELNERWQAPFPTQELNKLTAAINKGTPAA